MRARRAFLAVGGLIVLLMAAYVPAAALLGPAASPLAGAGAVSPPTSTIAPLPTYSRQVVSVNYTSDGRAGQSGVFWTELWYSQNGGPWALYAPPWNPSGHWPGAPLNSPMYVSVGTVLFDTFYTGGDARYNFTTVAVDRGFVREPGPSEGDTAPGAGHTKAKTIVDSTPPNVFIAKPTPDAWTNNGTLAWIAQDAVSGIAAVRVRVDGGAVQSFPQASGSLDMGLSAEGDHSVVLTAVDGAGNVNTITDPFHYDPYAPALVITSPTPNSYAKSTTVDVVWTLQDTGAGIASLVLQVDSRAPMSLPANATSYALSGLSEAGHILSLVAMDNAGNLASQIVSFGVDATPPSLSLVTPAAGSYVNMKQIQALWSASDTGSGIASYSVSLDGGSASTPSAPSFVFAGVAEGAHTVLVRAFDRAGNMAQASATVTVDVTPPDLQILSPAAGSQVTVSDVSVNWTATDAGSGIGQIFVVVDTGQPVGVSSSSVAQTVSPLSLGLHSVTVRVYDKAGNMAEKTVAFDYVGAVPPQTSGLPAIDFWVLMAIIGAIAVGSAYYAVRRRKRAKT